MDYLGFRGYSHGNPGANLIHPLSQELTHCSQRIQVLLFILFLFFTKLLTSISIGQALSHLLQPVHLSGFTGLILKMEYLDKSPDIVIKGQNILQYERLPQMSDKPIPDVRMKIFSPTIHHNFALSFNAGF